MIKASELRLGNWVYGTNQKQGRVTMKALKYIIDYAGIHQVMPIRISEELLLKCQFSKTRDYCYEWTHGDIGGWNLIFDFQEEEMKINFGDFNIEVKYLHQLQNILFSLTGKELEYTPCYCN